MLSYVNARRVDCSVAYRWIYLSISRAMCPHILSNNTFPSQISRDVFAWSWTSASWEVTEESDDDLMMIIAVDSSTFSHILWKFLWVTFKRRNRENENFISKVTNVVKSPTMTSYQVQYEQSATEDKQETCIISCSRRNVYNGKCVAS